MKKLRKAEASRAFSLVEVAIAFGIASFAILALTGLGSIALNQVRDSKRDILWVNITQEVVSELREKSWPNVKTLSFPLSYYFDADGRRLISSVGAQYECRVTAVSGQLPDAPEGSSASFLPLVVTLRPSVSNNEPIRVKLPVLLSQHDPIASSQ